jgi:hypothetical protein
MVPDKLCLQGHLHSSILYCRAARLHRARLSLDLQICKFGLPSLLCYNMPGRK